MICKKHLPNRVTMQPLSPMVFHHPVFISITGWSKCNVNMNTCTYFTARHLQCDISLSKCKLAWVVVFISLLVLCLVYSVRCQKQLLCSPGQVIIVSYFLPLNSLQLQISHLLFPTLATTCFLMALSFLMQIARNSIVWYHKKYQI